MSGSHDEELSKVYNFTMEDINSQRIRYQRAILLQAMPVKSSMGFSQGSQGCIMLVQCIKDIFPFLALVSYEIMNESISGVQN